MFSRFDTRLEQRQPSEQIHAQITHPSASEPKPSAATLSFRPLEPLSVAFSNTQDMPFAAHRLQVPEVSDGSLSHRFFPFRPGGISYAQNQTSFTR